MLGNWIVQTTTTTGAGNLTLAAVTGYPALSTQFAVGQVLAYTILDDATGVPIERGLGSLNGTGELVRSRIMATMSAGTYDGTNPAAVALPAGTKRVICTPGAGTVLEAAAWTPDTYSDVHGGAAVSTLTTVADQAYAVPFMHAYDCEIDAILFRMPGTTTAGVNVRLGIYTVGLNGAPGVKLAESGLVSAGSNGVKTGTFARFRPPSRYFCCMVSDGGVIIQSFSGVGSFTNILGTSGAALLPVTHYHHVGATGLNFPATWTTVKNDFTVQRPFLLARCV